MMVVSKRLFMLHIFHSIEPLNLIVEQGQEIEKDGRVAVQVSKYNQSFDVQITGSAVYVKDFQVFLES